MTKLPSAKQRRIVKAKIQGKTNREIAEVEYPNAKLEHDSRSHSGDVIVSKELKKPEVAQFYEQTKLIALKNNDISWNRVMSAVSDGLNDESIKVRLQAAKQASDYLDIPNRSVEEGRDILNNLPSNLSEIELQKQIFRVSKE